MSNQDNFSEAGRRPLKVRQLALMNGIASWLSNKNISPNSISIASVGFATLAAMCLVAIPFTSFPALMAIIAAIAIQFRLLCNLFDGMVAVEGGKGSRSGELFNDVPDRLADPIILIAAGYAAAAFDIAEPLGWCAATLAVMTAYIRTLAVSIGAPADFQGPMAKQHRMAIMTAACIFTVLEASFLTAGTSFVIALVIIVAGCLVTVARRLMSTYRFLEQVSVVSEEK